MKKRLRIQKKHIIDLKTNQVREHKLRRELEKYEEVKSMWVRLDKDGRKGNIGMACLSTEEQAKRAIKMLNKTKQYVASEYKHRKQRNNLKNSTKEENKRYKKPVEEKQLQKTKTCYGCGWKEDLIKSCKKNPNLLVTIMKNGDYEEWLDISEEEFKYFLEEYAKINSIKTQKK